MADLNYIYGTMESGKTTKLLIDYYNYLKNSYNVIIMKSIIDSKAGDRIESRLGNNRRVDILLKGSVYESLKDYPDAKIILVDECQFLNEEQVKELWLIAHQKNITVICYGLKNNFKGELFEGSDALFSWADNLSELEVICACGNKAKFNARMENGEYVYFGNEVEIDNQNNIAYQPLCSNCYYEKVVKPRKKLLLNKD